MKRVGVTGLVVLVMVLSLLPPVAIKALAEEECTGLLDRYDIPLEVSADIAFYSDYVWRGFLLDDDPVIQPGVNLSAYGFSASFWSSFDVITDDALDSDEVDFTLDYTYEHDLFSLSAGHTWYTFPAADTDTQEFYIGGSVNVPIFEDIVLSPGLKWFHDYGDTNDGGALGDYFLLDLGYSIPVADTGISVDLYNSVSYNNEFFINGDGGEYLVSAGLSIPLYKDNVKISPSISYSVPYGDLSDSSDGNQDDKLFGGATLSFAY